MTMEVLEPLLVLKVEDRMPGFEEKSGQDRDSIAETTGKKVVSRAASKRAGSRTTTIKKTRKWVAGRERWK